MHVHYRPASSVLDHLRLVDFVAVVGPTGAGKSSIITAAQQQWDGLRLVPSTLSRAPRPGEVDGVDAHFKTKPEMEQRIHAGEYATVVPNAFGDIYATAPEDFATDAIAAMPVLAGAVRQFYSLPFKRFRVVFIVPPSYKIWQTRVANHQFAPQKQQARLVEAVQSLQFALDYPGCSYIVNDNLQTAAANFIRLIRDNELSTPPTQARLIVQDILQALGTSQMATFPV